MATTITPRVGGTPVANNTARVSGAPSGGATQRVSGTPSANATLRVDAPTGSGGGYFGAAYFAARYFAAHFFGPSGSIGGTTTVRVSGALTANHTTRVTGL